MDTIKLKNRIQKKFRTISNFARISGIERYELQKLFAVKNPDLDMLIRVEKAYKMCKSVDTGNVISSDKLQALKACIDEAGGVYKFTTDFPNFTRRDVYDIYNGKRKRLTPFMQSLFDHFKILA
ncbi:MAG: hypothetical protein EBW87_02030 [Burkholderiaceae bacterium]|nr:hypothetical protein [Burkholderiaceae bacterium]